MLKKQKEVKEKETTKENNVKEDERIRKNEKEKINCINSIVCVFVHFGMVKYNLFLNLTKGAVTFHSVLQSLPFN